MTDFIRDLCDSVMPETYKPYALPDEIQECIASREKIYEKLKKRLGEDDFNMLEEFIDLNSRLHHENQCYAFSCGIKFIIRMLFGVFFKE